jgi:hypothetical protein
LIRHTVGKDSHSIVVAIFIIAVVIVVTIGIGWISRSGKRHP